VFEPSHVEFHKKSLSEDDSRCAIPDESYKETYMSYRSTVRSIVRARSDENDTVGPIEGGSDLKLSECKSFPIVIYNFGTQPNTIEVQIFRLHANQSDKKLLL